MQNKMVIETAVREAGNDPIFKVSGLAKKRIAEIGKEKVINATLGALMDDDGNLVAFDSVYSVFRHLDDADYAAYAGIAGTPEFLDNVTYACFKHQKPDAHIRAVATPGGTGAVRHAIRNYADMGDRVLIPDWHWAPYGTIADEIGREVTTFPLFSEDGGFNLDGYFEAFDGLLGEQKRVLSIINSPAHNPTGYSLTDDEWEAVKAHFIQKAEENPEYRIILLCDIAYIDFAGQDESARNFMKILTGMPENVLVLYAFSASKGYTMYGLRNGALLCAAPTEAIADEFAASCAFSNRGTWSNGTHAAMTTLAKIISDDDLRADFEAEQDKYRHILQARAKAFLDAAKDVGLDICPYVDGFFISIPCDHTEAVRDELMTKDFFIVALKKGLRFAPCAVSEEKCRKAPGLIKAAIEKVNG